MGAFGPAIFSDDVACDVRDAYKLQLDAGRSGPEATDLLLAEWLQNLPDSDEDVLVFWLALAATQSQLGRLEDRVRDKALGIIDGGQDLSRWKETGQELKRQAALLKLRAQLLGPQPEPKKVRIQHLVIPPWEGGDFVAMRLHSGRRIIFKIYWVCDVTGVSCSILDFIGISLPEPDAILRLPVKSEAGCRNVDFSIATFKKRAIPYDRLEVLPVKHTDLNHARCGTGWQWQDIDFYVKRDIGWD